MLAESLACVSVRSLSPMDNSTEELEPLFDYSRVQPVNVISLDDDSDSENLLPLKSSPKRMKISDPSCEEVNVVTSADDKDDEDWLLPPPPKISDHVRKLADEDSTIKQLRLKKQELASIAQSAEEALRSVEESDKKQVSNSELSSDCETEKPSKLHENREKIVISIQDKDGLKQFRIYKDESFGRLFKMYAEKVKHGVGSLVFSFDGDKVSSSATPAGLEMEDDDMIEVYVKSS